MTETAQLLSKVLVLEGDPACHDSLKAFCEGHHLVPLKAQADNLASVLQSNVDLGAIFLAEAHDGLALARRIRSLRPELPIFLRRSASASLDDLPWEARECFRAGYTLETMDALAAAIGQHIFSLSYPQALVRGIIELTTRSLESQFHDVRIEVEPPYVVRDRLIFGELFSLIPLESHWCRGYLLLQTEERALLDFIRADKTYMGTESDSFRDVNSLLGELTNLVWGTFKNRFVSDKANAGHLTQVPIVVNHLHRYISFGSEDPQLCIRYRLHDEAANPPTQVLIEQRFVFNLAWAPEEFEENPGAVAALFASGELEIF